MVGVRAFTPLCNSPILPTSSKPNPLFTSPTPSLFSFKTFQINLSVLSSLSHLKRTGLRAFAVKKRRRDKGGVLEKVEGFKGSYEFEEQVVDDEDEDEDEEGLLLPMEEMKQWFENRPAGFGQGKVYDTTVEDKLLDEIQQSRVAQLSNINKLKHNPIPPGGVGKAPVKAPEVAPSPSGVRVRLLNLPKKKNIHRDLQIAFKQVPGIVSISPAVTGTQKTRDPICKGYGFVYFKSEEHAKRFVQVLSTESIAFGKIQKQIKCELANPSSDDISPGYLVPNTLAKSSLPILSREEDLTTIIQKSKFPSKPSEDAESGESFNLADDEEEGDDDDLIVGEYSDDSYQSGDDISAGEYSDDFNDAEDDLITDELDQIPETAEPPANGAKPQPTSSAGKPFSSNKQETKLPLKKKAKAPKLGSANKLKSRDKSMLTDVFSKYGANAVSATSTSKAR